ncbi:cellulase family glycosylhydrolase [Aquisphaera insulae]|uniref:cellulase family glycosylhydrolase n=1 Tax=Aquisphaera insulae TaxID=2712864 RepID=UPI0013EBF41C|nr:cellulase family glycosylhydrolase [Aquisphaera insulae]
MAGSGFETTDGRPFTPIGLSYFRPGTGWAPQVWKKFDAEATRADFVRMKGMGLNVVRVFLSFGSFLPDRGPINPRAMAKFDTFLALAEENGLRVHPTGPDHWEGTPAWADVDRIADESYLGALEAFWTELAGRYKGRGVIFAYDLRNEPEVGLDSAPMRAGWRRWLERTYHSPEAAARAWGDPAPAHLTWEDLSPPAANIAEGGRKLRDYQLFRDELSVAWTARQARAIKAADPDALVTVGLIQWSIPLNLGRPLQYAGFRPSVIAPSLDFLEFHFYPNDGGYYDYSPASERHNLAYLAGVAAEVRRAAGGKPVVLAEFGWSGGGPVQQGGRTFTATEQDQARWGRLAVETSARAGACGWIHWGLYDHPGAGDVTQRIGLFRADGTRKAWAAAFSELARNPPKPAAIPRDLPPLNWDACITSRAACDRAREDLRKAFEKVP